jgi:hypothetical protein
VTGRRSIYRRIVSRTRWELSRLRRMPQLLSEATWNTPLHDLKARFGAVRQTEGALAAGSAAAIYVIFPTRGLQASHKLALRSLAAGGYAPIVVAHAPLAETERAELLTLCWRLIERPNFGYDFGGYRAGILSLGTGLARLDRLVFLNDSIWFPLPGAPDWLAQAEEKSVDFVGAVSNYGVPHVALDDYREAAWDYDPTRAGFHYCSFALWFGSAVLNDPAFLRFWRRFRLSDDKFRTVRRGEVGLSQFLLRRGFSHAETLGSALYGNEIRTMTAAELRHWIETLVIPEEPELEQLGLAVLAGLDRTGASDDARAYLLAAAARTGLAYALPMYAHSAHGHPMLKKSPLRLSASGAARTLAFLGTLEGPEAAVFLAEAEAIFRDRPALDPDPSARPHSSA